MKTRVITAIIALALFVGILLLPPIVFTIALAAVTLVMLYECYTATKADTAMKVVGFISAIILMFTMYFATHPNDFALIAAFVLTTIVLLFYMVLVVIKHGKKEYKDILSNGFMTLYITISMWCIVFIRQIYSTKVMLLIFVGAWSCDTFAYFFGRLFGKHKLIPHVSPNKTVEGAIGGVVGAIISCLIYLFILSRIPSLGIISFDSLNIMRIAAIGLLCGICSQIGDLIASAIKRDANIKDFGWIFPGHGGFMDRFDSVMFVAPMIWGIVQLIWLISD